VVTAPNSSVKVSQTIGKEFFTDLANGPQARQWTTLYW